MHESTAAMAIGAGVHAVILVEGTSDQNAVEALASRRGRDLDAEAIAVVSIGGARSIARYLAHFGPCGADVGLAGLYDAGEEHEFRHGLEKAGLGSALTRGDMEAVGFYACNADLEDELIRCLGTAVVEQILAEHDDLRSFRIFEKLPAQRDRTGHQRLRRFMGTRSGRKIHYARTWSTRCRELA
ncbi:MAG: TOPRIM nucleotidyl transferase/hydrolase domain-containing protein [Ilumatobacteraceae bacterium]